MTGEDAVDELTPGMSGRWLVTTWNGTTHEWDLDQKTYRRIARLAHGHAMDWDGLAHPIVRVERWPKIGSTFLVWFDDPANPLTIELSRRSSYVVSIEALDTGTGPGPGGADLLGEHGDDPDQLSGGDPVPCGTAALTERLRRNRDRL